MLTKTHLPCVVCRGITNHQKYPDQLGDESPEMGYDFSPRTSKSYRIVECDECSHVFADPMPHIQAAYRFSPSDSYVDHNICRAKTANECLKILASLGVTTGKLLDIGCNAGVFLDVASVSFLAEGIELSSESSAIASRRHVVYTDDFLEIKLETCYDVITAFAVLEHLENPRLAIAKARSSLREGGLFMVYVPDIRSLPAAILRQKWWQFMGMHLHYFSKSTMTSLLVSEGFTVEFLGRYPQFFTVRSIGNSLYRYRRLKWIAVLLNRKFFDRIILKISLPGELLIVGRARQL